MLEPTIKTPTIDIHPAAAEGGSQSKYVADFEKNQQKLTATLEALSAKAHATRERMQGLDEDANPRTEGVLKVTLARHERAMRLMRGDLEFMRPSSDEDVAYRLKVYNELPKFVAENIPHDAPLRFHGTRLAIAKDVISSGEISSSEDREGISTSPWGGGGMISVTRPENLHGTVEDYVDLKSRDFTVPAGCIFVLTPATPEEASVTEVMDNVYFKDRPERLVGIMTSPENIPLVKEWSAAAGIDPAKVGEFFVVAESLGKATN